MDGEHVLDPDHTSSVLSTVLTTINEEFEHECLAEAVRLLNAHPIRYSTDDRVPGHKYSFPGLPGTKFLAHDILAIWFFVGRRVCDSDMAAELVADEIDLGKTFTSVAAAMICKLLTEKVVLGVPMWIVWGNSHDKRVIMAPNDFPGIIGDERQRYPLGRWNSVPRHHSEIQSTPPQGHPALTSTIEPILVVTLPGVAGTFKSVINDMTYRTNFKLIDLLHAENANLTHGDLNTSSDQPENPWNIDVVSSNTLTSRAKPSRNGQLSHCLSSFCYGVA